MAERQSCVRICRVCGNLSEIVLRCCTAYHPTSFRQCTYFYTLSPKYVYYTA